MDDAALSDENILELEGNVRSKVDVLAPDIALGPQVFKDVMRKNMREKNVKYRYLLSDDPESIENLPFFIEELALGDAISSFEVRLLPSDVIESDIVIYDQRTANEHAFIASPSEADHSYWPVVGRALFRLIKRFNTLWHLGDRVLMDETGVSSPTEGSRGFLYHAWKASKSRKTDYLELWETVGRDCISRRCEIDRVDPRMELVQFLTNKYTEEDPRLPRFESLEYPEEIRDVSTAIHKEAVASYLAGADSASITMCGKLLETSLAYYWIKSCDEALEPRIGLGRLLGKIRDKVDGFKLDEGLSSLVDFVNKFRIISVHSKGKGKMTIPTSEISASVLSTTYDTINRIHRLS